MSPRERDAATSRADDSGTLSPARVALAAAGVALVVYLPSLAGGFLYDDKHVVVDNPYIRDLGQLGVILRHDPARPLLSLTWALNYALGGLTAWPYHLVNVLLHAGNAALAASLFLWMARRWGRPRPEGVALLGACLFAASPMAAETVAYVSSRSTALATLFGLAALRLGAGALAGAPRLLLPALACDVMALASKEEAVALPLLLLLLDFFFVAQQRASELWKRRSVHGWFLLLPALGLMARRLATGRWLPEPALEPVRFLATQVAAFPLYFLRALVPLDPAFYRNHSVSPWPPNAATLAGALVTLGLVAAALAWRRSRPEWSLSVCWLGASLLPSSSFVALKEMVVDHRAYLGAAGIDFALGWLLWRPGRARLCAALLVLLAARAAHYEWVLADPARSWQDAVRRAPRSGEAWRALGEAYAARRDPRAEAALAQAANIDPRDARGWTNLGAYYAEQGRLIDAESAMRAAARAAPGDARVRDNLGMILQAQGRVAEAQGEFEAAVAGQPPLAQPRLNLAALLMRRGEVGRARSLVEEAARYVQDAQESEAVGRLRDQLRVRQP